MKFRKIDNNMKLEALRIKKREELAEDTPGMLKFHMIYTVDGVKSEQTVSAVNVQKAEELIKKQYDGKTVSFSSKQQVKEGLNEAYGRRVSYDELIDVQNRIDKLLKMMADNHQDTIETGSSKSFGPDFPYIMTSKGVVELDYMEQYIENNEYAESLQEKFGKQEKYDLEQILDFTENNIKIWKKLLSKKSYDEVDTGYFDSLYDDFKHTFDKIKNICYRVNPERFSALKTESLNENIESPEKVIENEEKVPQTDEAVGLANMIIKEINGEWETISNYNDLISLMRSEGQDDMIDVISDIVDEENKHVGQLQKCLQIISPNVSEIDSGESEAKEQLDVSEECEFCADDDFGPNSGFDIYLV